jgi:membrane protease YdiL (CAAX protease family)
VQGTVKGGWRHADATEAMPAPATLETRPRQSRRRWPPSAKSQGVELPTVVLILILVSLTFVGYLLIAAAPRDQGPTPYIRWLLITSVVELIVWLGVVGAFGWRKGVGLVWGSWSLWGIVPLAALSIASVLAAGRAGEPWVGAGLQVAIVVGIFVAALTEEVAFRGFLFHGLTRRLGGATAVVTGSVLYSIYHLPVLIREDVRGSAMVIRLISHFAFGMFLCRVRAQTGSIWFPTAIHTLWNLTTVEIVIWAFPEGHYPDSLSYVRLAIDGTGLFLACGLLFWALVAHSARSLVSGPLTDDGKRIPGAKPISWRSFYWSLGRSPSPADFERYTGAAWRAVVLAQEEARCEEAKAVGTEHLLLALTHESDGVASEALEGSGIPLRSPTRLGELLLGRREHVPPPPLNVHSVPFDPQTKMILQLAVLEANAWKHQQIGTEHLLLGLTALRRGGAARVLRKQGIDRGFMRRRTLRLLTERTWSTTDASEARAGDVVTPSQPGKSVLRIDRDRLDHLALRILIRAEDEARAQASPSIGTKHLLLGLVGEHEGIAAKALEASGMPVRSSERSQETLGRSAPSAKPHLPLTPRAKKALGIAASRAGELGESQIRTEHILLGLIDDPQGEAISELRAHGVDPVSIRRIVHLLLKETARSGVPDEAADVDAEPAAST